MTWWSGQNGRDRHLWPGLNTAKVANWGVEEITKQILLTRQQPRTGGVIQWGARDLLHNTSGIDNALLRNVYQELALVPASPWLGAGIPGRPSVAIARLDPKGAVIWKAAEGEAVVLTAK